MNKPFLALLILALMLPLCGAVSTHDTTIGIVGDSGLGIESLYDSSFKLNEIFNLTFYVFNISTRKLQAPTSIDCLIHFINYSGGMGLLATPSYDSEMKHFYYEVPAMSEVGEYSYTIYCNTTEHGVLASNEIKITKDGKDKQVPGPGLIALILLPLFFSIIAMFGAATLGEDYVALKLGFFIFSIVPMFASLNLGLLTIVKFYDFPELENALAGTSYWMSLFFFTIVSIFCLHFVYKMFKSISDRKRERLNY